jgi:hypothetical protein
VGAPDGDADLYDAPTPARHHLARFMRRAVGVFKRPFRPQCCADGSCHCLSLLAPSGADRWACCGGRGAGAPSSVGDKQLAELGIAVLETPDGAGGNGTEAS